MKFLYRLKFVTRFNHRSKICIENVAEHSYFVAIFSLLTADKFKLKVDRAKMLQMAMLHDVPESITGDVLHQVKKARPIIKGELTKMEVEVMKQFFSPELASVYEQFEENNTLEAQVVLLADIMSILLYINNEESLGNENFNIVKRKTEKRMIEHCQVMNIDYNEAKALIEEDDIYDD